MKILIISGHQKFGGAEQSALYLADGLRDLGHEVERICYYGDTINDDKCICIRKSKRRLPLPRIADFVNPVAAYRLRRIVRMKHPDVLCFQNINDFAFSLLSLFVLREYPTVWTLHDWWVLGGGTIMTSSTTDTRPKMPINLDWEVQFPRLPMSIRYAERLIFKYIQPHLVMPTIWLQQSLTSSPLLRNLTSSVIPLGIDTNLFQPSKTPPKTHRLLYVGRLNERKGYATLATAFEKVLREFPDAELWAVGSHGPDHQEGSVRILHTRSAKDLSELYHQATILVSPGLETPGLASLEALASGIPVVVPDTPPVREYLDETVANFFSYHDSENLANVIINLLKNPEKREEMGKLGRELIGQKFSNRLMAQNYEKLFNKISKKI